MWYFRNGWIISLFVHLHIWLHTHKVHWLQLNYSFRGINCGAQSFQSVSSVRCNEIQIYFNGENEDKMMKFTYERINTIIFHWCESRIILISLNSPFSILREFSFFSLPTFISNIWEENMCALFLSYKSNNKSWNETRQFKLLQTYMMSQ